MSTFIISVFSIPSFLGAILLFRFAYKKYYDTSFSKVMFLGGISLFILYVVFQTVTHIYSLDKLERYIIVFCNGLSLLIGPFLIFATHERFLISENLSSSINQKILAATLAVYLIALVLPASVATYVENYCSNEHKLGAKRIIDAVNQYRTSENKIPDKLDLLTPTYLAVIPFPKCFSIYHPFIPALTDTEFLRSMDYWVMMDLIKLRKLEYHIKKCEWVEDDVYSVDLYLLVPTIDLDGKDRYDFFSNSWERISYRYDECLPFDMSD